MFGLRGMGGAIGLRRERIDVETGETKRNIERSGKEGGQEGRKQGKKGDWDGMGSTADQRLGRGLLRSKSRESFSSLFTIMNFVEFE